jgi:hypothetical protein
MFRKKAFLLLLLGLCAANLAVTTAEAKPVRGRVTPYKATPVPDTGNTVALFAFTSGAIWLAHRLLR